MTEEQQPEQPEQPEQPQPTIKRPYRKYYTAQDKALVNEYTASFDPKYKQTLLIAQSHLKTSFDVLKTSGFVKWLVQTAADAAKKGELLQCDADANDGDGDGDGGEEDKGRCYVIRGTIYIYENQQRHLFEAIEAKKLIAPLPVNNKQV